MATEKVLRTIWYPPQRSGGYAAYVAYREVELPDGSRRVERFVPRVIGGRGEWETVDHTWDTVQTWAIEDLGWWLERVKLDKEALEHVVQHLQMTVTPEARALQAEAKRLAQECAALTRQCADLTREVTVRRRKGNA